MGNPLEKFFISYTFTGSEYVTLETIGLPAIVAGYEIANKTTAYNMKDSLDVVRPYEAGQQDKLYRQSPRETFKTTGLQISGIVGDVVEGEYWK